MSRSDMMFKGGAYLHHLLRETCTAGGEAGRVLRESYIA